MVQRRERREYLVAGADPSIDGDDSTYSEEAEEADGDSTYSEDDDVDGKEADASLSVCSSSGADLDAGSGVALLDPTVDPTFTPCCRRRCLLGGLTWMTA